MRWKEAGTTLYARFVSIWGNRFTSQFDDELFINVWIEEWGRMVCSHGRPNVRKAIDICKAEMAWPPVMAEFLEVCDRVAGKPSIEEAYEMAVRRDFSCPMVKAAFSKLNSWDFRHKTDKETRKMFAQAWDDVCAESRKNTIGYSGAPLLTING